MVPTVSPARGTPGGVPADHGEVTTPQGDLPPDPELPSPEVRTTDPSADAARRRTLTVIGLIVAAVVAGGALALLRPDASQGASEWSGTPLGIELAKPAIALTDTSGERFDLAADTRRPLTLVMFGYTNCPDVCPISLSTLSSALRAMGPEVAKQVQMVFVTVDPDRDTRERLREYLDQFDPAFVGLTGTRDELARAQELANVPEAFLEDPREDGSYEVGHATQMIAYQSDGIARIVYPFGTREVDWASDLPRLLDGELPS